MNALMADIEKQIPQGAPPAPMPASRPTDMMGGIGALPVEVMQETEVEAGGIGDVQSAVDLVRSFGRETDQVLAHLSPDEMVVPNEILESNPQIKELIFAEMRMMGIEEPERYVAGSGLNSINPDTGLPEFFLKKIAKGISSVVKSVGKVIKKVAPVILPIALSMTGLGPVYGAALGSGLGTLVQGGDLKDAFKSALIGGAVGGISSGVSSKLSGGTFTGGFGDAFADPSGRFSQALSNVKSGTPFAGYTPPSGAAASQSASSSARPPARITPSTTTQAAQRGSIGADSRLIFNDAGDLVPLDSLGSSSPTLYDQTIGKATELYDQYLSPSRGMPSQTELLNKAGQIRTAAASEGITISGDKALEMAAKEMKPGIISQYAPLAAVGTGIMAAAGGFETPEVTPYDAFAGQKRYADMTPEERAQYSFGLGRADRTNYSPMVRSPYVTYAAAGGAMTRQNFPRRNGFVAGPGTETSDDIPAMLSDGEFVLTAKAVRGAGNGDRQRGVANLYDMMRSFERMA